MKYRYMFTFFVIISSCNSKNTIEVYKSVPLNEGTVIRGSNISAFFSHESETVSRYELESNVQMEDEILEIKSILSNNESHDIGVGIYYYALIYKNDTLYTNSDFSVWKLNNKVGVYNSVDLRQAILKK